jgi:hypothetical protein
VDNTAPSITDLKSLPSSPEVFAATNISAVVADNSGLVISVRVEVFDPNNNRLGNFTMVLDAGTGRYYYVFNPSLLGTYTYRVWARDGVPNTGTASSTLIATDTTNPIANAGADRSVERAVAILLDGSTSSDNYGITNYTWSLAIGGQQVYLYGESVQYTFASSGVYVVTLTVRDASGNVGTDTVTVTVQDTVRPSIPSEPQVVQGTEQGTILLAWSTVADGDVAGYNVYRSDKPEGPYVKVNAALVTDTTYVDEGLADGQTYYYRITAVDQDGNESPQSLAASASTKPSLLSPTTPTGLGLLLGLIAVAGALVGLAMKRRKRGPKGPKGGSEGRGGPGSGEGPKEQTGKALQEGESPKATGEGSASPRSDSREGMQPGEPTTPPPDAPPPPPPPPPETTASTSDADELLLLLKDAPDKKPKSSDEEFD